MLLDVGKLPTPEASWTHLVVIASADEQVPVRRARQRANGVAVPHERQPAQLSTLGHVPETNLRSQRAGKAKLVWHWLGGFMVMRWRSKGVRSQEHGRRSNLSAS